MLLREDSELSKVERVHLCEKHRAGYALERWVRKCPVGSCQRLAGSDFGGIPMCGEHSEAKEKEARAQREQDARSLGREVVHRHCVDS